MLKVLMYSSKDNKLLRTSEGFGAWKLQGWGSTFCFDFTFGHQYGRPVEVRLQLDTIEKD